MRALGITPVPFFVRRLAAQFDLSLATDRNALGESARGNIAGHDLRLLIPETFMNESGRSVAAMARYYRIDAEEILIAHDELDVPPGEARFKCGGGHGGHNGLRDIIPALGGQRSSGDCDWVSVTPARQSRFHHGF